MKFQDKFYVIFDHNKCPPGETEDEKCIFRKSYFHRIQPSYEVDLNRFSKKDNLDKELELGFTFLMDYNEDRQVDLDEKIPSNQFGLTSSVVKLDQSQNAIIYLDTIGKGYLCFFRFKL